MTERTIDACGMLCPKPLILVKKALKEMKEGETLLVRLDNDMACQNVKRLLQDHNCQPTAQESDGKYTIRAVKGIVLPAQSSSPPLSSWSQR